MDNQNPWESYQDYSAFIPDDNFNLFGDPGLNFDFPELPFLDLGDPSASQHFTDLDFDSLGIGALQGAMDLSSTLTDCVMRCEVPEPRHPTASEADRSSPAPPHCDVHRKKTHRKRFHEGGPSTANRGKWEDSVIVFGAQPEIKVALRKRKRFDASRRQEVALHRLVGACIQCKLRKASVSTTLTQVVDGTLIY